MVDPNSIECPKVSNSTTPDELANYLNSSVQSADSQCVTEMIHELSYVRDHATPFQIQTLINLLDFQRPETDLERMHIWSSSNGDQFPAVDALFRIGQTAVPQLIKSLGTGLMTVPARQNAVRTLIYIYRKNPPDAVKAIAEAAKKSSKTQEATQLESSAKDAATFCEKFFEQKNQCDEPLQAIH